ncbi:hypothetical protein BDD12DRAFT_915223 [Trichophaea hybrida]|nr:hypothetical protein BDD12DRAFT_915223 [Trichophaea hybrida]
MELNGNLYQYVTLGTGSINPNLPGVSGGRVIVLSLRRNTDGMVEIRKRTQVICDEPVYSLAPYGSSSLLYCSGTKLYMRAFNLDTKKLDVIAETKLRSSAVQISVSEQLIYLSCASDSILAVKFENNKLVETFSDEVARNGFHHVKLLQDLVVATDKQYSIVGLWQPRNKPTLQSLTTIFEADLTSSVSRIRRGICRPPWVPPTRHLPGVISGTENVIAAGVDGSFFQLTILDERALRLLRFVQKLYREETTGAPFAPPEPEPESRDPRTAHIDGDLLVAVVRLGVDWLRRVVERSEEGREHAFEGSEGFQSVAVELLGDKEDVYEASMRYVDELVNDAIL